MKELQIMFISICMGITIASISTGLFAYLYCLWKKHK